MCCSTSRPIGPPSLNNRPMMALGCIRFWIVCHEDDLSPLVMLILEASFQLQNDCRAVRTFSNTKIDAKKKKERFYLDLHQSKNI